MAKFIPKVYPQILQRMIDRTVARTGLSDLTETSQVGGVLSATAREIADVYFQMKAILDLFSITRAAGEDLEERGKDYGLTKIAATQASGNLVFTRAVAGPIIIPAGTRVQIPNSSPLIVAKTSAAVNIPLGVSSGNVPAVVELSGTIGNAQAGTFTQFAGLRPSGIDAVINPAGFTGGTDKESDDAFRARIQNHVATLSRCTVQALEFISLSTVMPSGQRVVFARAVEDPLKLGRVYMYIDDGTGAAESNDDNYGTPEILTTGAEFPLNVAQGGEQYLYLDNFPVKDSATINVLKGLTVLVRDDAGANGYTLNSASGQIYLNSPLIAGEAVTAEYTWYTGLMKQVQKVIDGDPLDRINFAGWRAAGVLVLVRVPSTLTITIEANITVADGYNVNSVADLVKNELANYVNSLGIGNDVIKSELIERAMAVEGMYDINIVTPLSNIVILDDQLPRTNVLTDITLV